MDFWYKRGKSLLSEISKSRPGQGETHIWFAGQHGFIIKLGGEVFYIDVILNELFDENGDNIRVYPPPFQPDEARPADYVLCTHNHIDHLNMETLLPMSKANPITRFIVPAPCKNLLVDAGIPESRVLAARINETLSLGSASIKPVPAFHTLRIHDEGEKDENGDFFALGYILQSDGIFIYHSGDTWVTPSLVSALAESCPIDIAMLPINGTDWERTSQNIIGNMGAQDAAKLVCALDIELAIPAHYDMIAHNSENPARFAETMRDICPNKRFHIFSLGERFIYRKD